MFNFKIRKRWEEKKTYQEPDEEEEEIMDDETIIEIMFPDGVENEEDWPNYDD